jgi:hypothetical protein
MMHPERNRLLRLTLLGLPLAFVVSCRAVESLTANTDGFWESPCHPGIYLTDTPPAATPACAWHYVSHRSGR